MTETIAVGSISAELVQEASDLLALASSYAIDSPEMREAASLDLKRIKALAKSVDEQEKEITRPINTGLKKVRDLFRAPKEWLEKAEAALKTACLTWDDAQERERRRIAAEAARKADEERQRLEAAAAREAAAGNTETAAAIKEAAAFVAPAPVEVAPKLAGEAHREVWSAAVVDIVAVCRGVAEGKIPPQAVEANMVYWNGVARSFKASFDFPGMRAVSKKILASVST